MTIDLEGHPTLRDFVLAILKENPPPVCPYDIDPGFSGACTISGGACYRCPHNTSGGD